MFFYLACELKEMLSCRSIDISSFKNTQNLKKKTFELVCDDECFLAERNRNMATALQIDPNSKPKAIYSDFLKSYAREEPGFVFDLEKRFDTLVSTKISILITIWRFFHGIFVNENLFEFSFTEK